MLLITFLEWLKLRHFSELTNYSDFMYSIAINLQLEPQTFVSININRKLILTLIFLKAKTLCSEPELIAIQDLVQAFRVCCCCWG